MVSREDGYTDLEFGGGVDNRSRPIKVSDRHVVRADNVDIDKDGVVTRRTGYTPFAALVNAHSLWSHDLLSFGLVADTTQLYRIDSDGNLTSIAQNLNGGDVSCAVIGQRLRWSNGAQTGQMDLSGTVAPLGVETPLPSFDVVANATGGLPAGRYGVTMTFANAIREEGGAPDTTFVDVIDGGGIQIVDVPTSQAGDAVEARMYVTEPNGTELFYAGSTLPGAGAFLIGTGVRARILATQFCEPFPPAKNLLAKAGRLFGTLGRRLIWSEPMYYGLWRPTLNGLLLPDDITMIAAPDTPRFLLYLGTKKKTYVLQGDAIDSTTLSVACAAGVIPGSMAMAPSEVLHLEKVDKPVPLWAGTDGIPYVGTELGVLPLSSVFTYPIYDQAAAAFVQQDGLSRFIVSGKGGSPASLAMNDRAVATIIQNGT